MRDGRTDGLSFRGENHTMTVGERDVQVHFPINRTGKGGFRKSKMLH